LTSDEPFSSYPVVLLSIGYLSLARSRESSPSLDKGSHEIPRAQYVFKPKLRKGPVSAEHGAYYQGNIYFTDFL
jgi:hypothetical protein